MSLADPWRRSWTRSLTTDLAFTDIVFSVEIVWCVVAGFSSSRKAVRPMVIAGMTGFSGVVH